MLTYETGKGFAPFWRASACNGVEGCRKSAAKYGKTGSWESGTFVVAHLSEKDDANGLKGTLSFSGRFKEGTCSRRRFVDYKLTLKGKSAHIEAREELYDDFPAKDISECGASTKGPDRSKLKHSCKMLKLFDATRVADLSK